MRSPGNATTPNSSNSVICTETPYPDIIFEKSMYTSRVLVNKKHTYRYVVDCANYRLQSVWQRVSIYSSRCELLKRQLGGGGAKWYRYLSTNQPFSGYSVTSFRDMHTRARAHNQDTIKAIKN